MIAPNSIFQTVSTLALLLVAVTQASPQQDAEEARWLVQASQWGTLSWLESDDLTSLVTSIASSDGRIFFYLTEQSTFEASLTLSEAQTDPAHFEGAGCGPDGSLDPEDPVSFLGNVLFNFISILGIFNSRPF